MEAEGGNRDTGEAGTERTRVERRTRDAGSDDSSVSGTGAQWRPAYDAYTKVKKREERVELVLAALWSASPRERMRVSRYAVRLRSLKYVTLLRQLARGTQMALAKLLNDVERKVQGYEVCAIRRRAHCLELKCKR